MAWYRPGRPLGRVDSNYVTERRRELAILGARQGRRCRYAGPHRVNPLFFFRVPACGPPCFFFGAASTWPRHRTRDTRRRIPASLPNRAND